MPLVLQEREVLEVNEKIEETMAGDLRGVVVAKGLIIQNGELLSKIYLQELVGRI